MNQVTSTAIDQSVFNNLKDSMGEVFDDILTVFLDETESLISRIKEQIESDDIEGMSMTAHTLKSSTKTLGANQLSNICAELEDFSSGSSAEVNILYDNLVKEKKAVMEAIEEITA